MVSFLEVPTGLDPQSEIFFFFFFLGGGGGGGGGRGVNRL